MPRFARTLAAAIPTAMVQKIEAAGHAAPFDATLDFVQLIADSAGTANENRGSTPRDL
jgi:hypothetical protein